MAEQKTVSGTREREIALEVLLQSEKGGQNSRLLKKTLDRYADLPDAQRSFIKRLTEGTTERRIELDARLGRYLKTPVEKLRPVVRQALRLGAYQILYMDAVPDAAACNEAVRLVQKRGLRNLSGLVNGVLRNLAREAAAERGNVGDGGGSPAVSSSAPVQTAAVNGRRSHLPSGMSEPAPVPTQPDKAARRADFLSRCSVRYSMPEWIVSLWRETYGEAQTEALLESLLQVRPVSIRLDERLSAAEREAALTALRGVRTAQGDAARRGLHAEPEPSRGGLRIEPGRWLPYCYQLYGARGVAKLLGFAEGLWTVQDESSMLVAEAAGIRTGRERVLDLCAAPGGKSCHAAVKLLLAAQNRAAAQAASCAEPPQAAHNRTSAQAAPRAEQMQAAQSSGLVLSYDLTEKKVALIRENLLRLRLPNVLAAVHDARRFEPSWEKSADIVLCDLPCSGLGVIGKKRDIKYNVTLPQLKELAALQREILTQACCYVKPGGVLLYSTCTIDRAENEETALWAERTLGLRPDSLRPYLPAGLPGLEAGREHMVQLLPHIHGTDGFFMARFIKE